MKKNYRCAFSLLLILTTHIQFIFAGDLDQSFGGSGTGIAITSIQRFDFIQSCTIQADDKLVVVGNSTGFDQELALVRYTDNGLLDTSFSSDGIEKLLVGTTTIGNAIDLQSDAKIVVCGAALESQTNILAGRYTTSGALDLTFDGDGYVTTSTGTGATANSVKVQTDGKIVVGGTTISEDIPIIFLARYNSNGSLDGTFGSSGTVITPIDDQASLHQIALQSDGKIVGVGYVQESGITKFVIIRYNTDGSLDNSFGTSGITTTEIGPYSIARAVAIQSDGKIVVVGYTTEARINKFAIARYDTSGGLDATFNATGIVTTQLQYDDEAYAVLLQNDGKILVGGSSLGNDARQFAIARYTTSGSIDTSFGINGIATTTIGGENSQSQINALVFQSNGKIVAAGPSNTKFALARYTA